MLDINFVRENPEKVKQNCINRQLNINVDKLLELDKQRRKFLQKIESLRAERNKQNERERGREIKTELKELEPKLKDIEKEFDELACLVPNMILEDVPIGKDERNNKVVKTVGEPKKFNFKIKDHMKLGEELDLIDTERAGKVSGSRFVYLKGKAALIQFALINLGLETLLKKGFTPILPPVMLKAKMAKGMGYLEQADSQEAYYLTKDDSYLIGTSEQSIGVMHTNEIFPEDDLPKKYVGFSTCFRREAGSYGKDMRGIIRLHQFDKLEMFVFAKPENSKKEHQLLLDIEEELMQKLELPYQILHLCSADIGRPSASTFDIETWLPSQNKYRETHSCSNCTDFQARRLKIRYKRTNPPKASHLGGQAQKTEFVHMLNGTAFAIPRLLIALLENNQQKNGSIKMPKALQKYLGFKKIKPEK